MLASAPSVADPLPLIRVLFLVVYAAVFLVDLRTRLIPNVITYPAIAAALVVRPDGIGPIPPGHLAAGLGAAALFALLAWRGWMGVGDVKLALLIGLLSGPLLTPIALWIGFVSGGLVAIALLALGLKRRRDAVPFGPYLALGGAAVLVAGPQLLGWSGLGSMFGE